MGHHDGRQAIGDQAAIGGQVARQVGELPPVHGQRQVGVGNDGAVSWKVLRGGGHPRIAHAVHVGDGQRAHGVGIAVEGPICDEAHTVVEVDTRARRTDRPRARAAPRP